jgi:selenobiotic family peptide radical SAM maturase
MIRDRWFFARKTKTFTLQWHLTNACHYHCRHCYDRSDRHELGLVQALEVLADLAAFCRKKRVAPRLSLSGGDPVLYSHFWELLDAIAKARIPFSILGNPIDSKTIRRLLDIQSPGYYQVSLEGLREHNDTMRGSGHFDRVMDFLVEARKHDLTTHVMLTLTRANLDQVILLGESLRGLTARFTFNRLSTVGEAVELEMPNKRQFVDFLKQYLAASRTNPVLGFKDNLFNIIRSHFRRRLYPGCTGYGCGAAFNFVALLPDGEVHACRKYPSALGNIGRSSLEEIYDSQIAQQYRNGVQACRNCRLRRVCGGCPAVSFGQGLDPLVDCDSYCFLSECSEYLN